MNSEYMLLQLSDSGSNSEDAKAASEEKPLLRQETPFNKELFVVKPIRSSPGKRVSIPPPPRSTGCRRLCHRIRVSVCEYCEYWLVYFGVWLLVAFCVWSP